MNVQCIHQVQSSLADQIPLLSNTETSSSSQLYRSCSLPHPSRPNWHTAASYMVTDFRETFSAILSPCSAYCSPVACPENSSYLGSSNSCFLSLKQIDRGLLLGSASLSYSKSSSGQKAKTTVALTSCISLLLRDIILCCLFLSSGKKIGSYILASFIVVYSKRSILALLLYCDWKRITIVLNCSPLS